MNLSVKATALVVGLSLSLLATKSAQAATFSFNPTITFEVIDGGSSGSFDGAGDEVFPGNFDTVVKGSFGENSEIAEINIGGFSIPTQEYITSAIFKVRGLGNLTFGFGTSGERPTSLAVRGFVGNGQVDASDFQAGTILDTVNVSPDYIDEDFSFDVTTFVSRLVNNGDLFAGFGIRSQDFGGLTLFGANFAGPVPTLTITTAPVPVTPPTTVPEPSFVLSILAFGALGASSVLKRKQKSAISVASIK